MPVTSGVPQGSVLGPTLFLAYINDLPQHLNCSLSLFADDTLIYQVVDNLDDKKKFQSNIEALESWTCTWGMSFNVNKCSVLVFNDHNSSPDANYSLGGVQLEVVHETKYLGVLLQSDFKFGKHLNDKINKAKRQLGLITRTLFKAPESAKLLAYKSLCRPHVEYAATLWDPHLEYLIHDIEMVQHKAIRFITNLKGRDSITKARTQLNLETLTERRRKARHCLLLKLLSDDEHHGSMIKDYDELTNSKDMPITRATSRGAPPTIYAKTSVYYNSFLPKTVREMKANIFT